MKSVRCVRVFAIFLTLYFLGLIGCSTAYVTDVADRALSDARLQSHYAVERNATWVVHTNTPVFLAHPADIRPDYRGRQVFNLYRSLDLTLQQTFPSYVTHDGPVNLQAALELAANHHSELLFFPKLVNTEDKRSSRQEFLEGADLHPDKKFGTDKTVFQILIYEVRTQKLIDVATIKGRGKLFSSTVTLPQDLFEQAALHFAYAITGKLVGFDDGQSQRINHIFG